ncbi:MAG: hypothetical protein ACI8W7_003736, partial [Gammaproteobacteria bacterium]
AVNLGPAFGASRSCDRTLTMSVIEVVPQNKPTEIFVHKREIVRDH